MANEEELDDPEFRRGVAQFLQDNWVEGELRHDHMAFRNLATKHGYLYRNVPRKYGGSEQSPNPLHAYIIRREFQKVRAPRELPGRSIDRVVPVLLHYGTDWQKEYFIPRTIAGEFTWCQGYSEPSAGSDVASLRTKAELIGDEWVINGQKVWTSGAFTMSHMFILVRTEPNEPKHAGISYLLLEMRQPGVTVRPLKQLTGQTEFNEVFFDDAKTPAHWIVGERGEGWAVSRMTLAFERAAVGSPDGSMAIFDRLVGLAKTTMLDGQPAVRNPLIRDELARIHSMLQAHRAASDEALARALRGKEGELDGGAYTKLYNSFITEAIARLSQRVIGDVELGSPSPDTPGPARWINQYFNSIASHIGGGTSNMQRNMIAERTLGMPRG
jgi:alkylation response protein AidB-like acyl-CoA dehydrogenase